jgi:iron(III) transport system substrate-binding protein
MQTSRSPRAVLIGAGLTFGLAAGAMAQEVNLYSSRHYDNDAQLYDMFTEATGITVNRIEGTPEELIARMQAEGANSPADVLLTVDAGRIWLADQEGLLQPVESAVLEERIPDYLRHPDGHWFGLSQRARIIYYARDRLDTPPQTYEALADPEYQGKVCIRTASNVYNLSLMSGIIEHQGEEGARGWAQGLKDNLARAPEGGDTDQLKGIVSGACDIAVANTYYFARAKAEPVEGLSEAVDQIGWVMPNQETTGTHVNVAAAGVAAHAPNRDAAVAFLEFLTTPEAQAFFANQNHEFPVVEGVEVGPIAAEFGDFKRDTINLSLLGVNQPKAQEIFNEVGFP